MGAITIEQARKVMETVDAGLVSGVGEPIPGKMCVEAAVCYALGQPHGDRPACVNPVVRSFKIALNDKAWPSEEARATGMRRIAIAQLGSAEDGFDAAKFLSMLAELTIRRIVPLALRSAAEMESSAAHKDALRGAATRCENEGTRESASEARVIARNAYAAAATTTTAAAAAAYATYADAATYAADATYAAATYAAYAAADYAADRTKYLTMSAEIGVDALRAAGSPGIALMDELCPI